VLGSPEAHLDNGLDYRELWTVFFTPAQRSLFQWFPVRNNRATGKRFIAER